MVPSLEWQLIQSQYELKQIKTPNSATWETFAKGLQSRNHFNQPIEADEVEMP